MPRPTHGCRDDDDDDDDDGLNILLFLITALFFKIITVA
jgi:hypothetical protein